MRPYLIKKQNAQFLKFTCYCEAKLVQGERMTK